MKRLFNKQHPSAAVDADGAEGTQANGQDQPTNQSNANKRRSALGFMRRGSTEPSSNGPILSQNSQTSNQRMSMANIRTSPREYIVQTIGFLCASGIDDWSRVLRLCDEVSSSEDMAKEAAKALRKEVELGQPEAQKRAARLCVIMMRNATDRFRLQIASKKFCETYEKTIKSSKTTAEVKEMLLKALSVLAYENRNDRDLSSLTNLYNKVKAPTDPIGGNAQDAEDPVFDPQIQSQHFTRRRPNDPYPTVPDKIDLFNEATMAKSSANMLTEALSFTKAEDLDDNDLVKEFYSNCQHAQGIFVDALPWAAAQAEQAASKRQADAEATTSATEGRPEIDPPENSGEPKQTNEEALLNIMLEANAELQAAFSMYDSVQRRKKQNDDERLAHDRSLVEQKMERTNLVGHSMVTLYSNEQDDGLLIGDLPSENNTNYLAAPVALSASSSRSSPGSHNIGLPVLKPTQAWKQPSSLELSVAMPQREPERRLPTPPPVSNTIRTVPTPESPPSRNPYAAMLNSNSNGDKIKESTPPLNSRNPFARAAQSSPRRYDSEEADFPRTDSPISDGPSFLGTLDENQEEAQPNRNPFHRLEQPSISSTRLRNRQTSNGSSILTPVEPSEKALGKLRRFSHLQDDSIEEAERVEQQQHALEAALRQKYANHATERDVL